jgi:prepilin-type processing-associated H-X9-DG protein
MSDPNEHHRAQDSGSGGLPPEIGKSQRQPNDGYIVDWRVFVGILCAVLFLGCCLLWPAFDTGPRAAAPRSQCKNNLKQIGIALQNYHEAYGSFPPAYIADENGRPIHSWRVLILPYIDMQPLYNRYRFDEPWDGPNNRLLADMSPTVFGCPSEEHAGDEKDPKTTSYVAVIGPETAWPGDRLTSLSDIKDGTSKTLLLVEVANSGIRWSEPRDLHVLQMAPAINPKAGQGISSRHKGGATAMMCDGSALFLGDSLPAETLRAMLTAHVGDHVGEY